MNSLIDMEEYINIVMSPSWTTNKSRNSTRYSIELFQFWLTLE